MIEFLKEWGQLAGAIGAISVCGGALIALGKFTYAMKENSKRLKEHSGDISENGLSLIRVEERLKKLPEQLELADARRREDYAALNLRLDAIYERISTRG